MAEVVLKRSARQRSGSSKVRVFDVHMRKEIKRKRLAALEQDNWHEERRAAEVDDDEDYNPLDASDNSDDGAPISCSSSLDSFLTLSFC